MYLVTVKITQAGIPAYFRSCQQTEILLLHLYWSQRSDSAAARKYAR
jgi:hypothetical protein